MKHSILLSFIQMYFVMFFIANITLVAPDEFFWTLFSYMGFQICSLYLTMLALAFIMFLCQVIF